MRKEVIMGYGYDPEETTGQEHMDDTAPESGGQKYTDSAQEYTDSAQNAGAGNASSDGASDADYDVH